MQKNPGRIYFPKQNRLFFRGCLGRSGRSRRTKIRSKIRNSCIGLMTDAGNNRNMTIDDRLSDDLLIKTP